MIKTRLLAFFLLIYATSGSASERPTIGLVLSGGGARGLSHIGTLELLEELRVPVDYVAGTSMGAIIGGLYASGLSPAQIKAAMVDMDWEDLFLDQPPRDQRSFRRKQDDRSDFHNFLFGLRGLKPALPRGLIAGQKFTLSMKYPQLFTANTQHFDDLPIPFRAVATDIETGEMVILSQGSLLHAMRASMAIPGVFNPLYLDGRWLIDGGILRNLPVDVAQQMGADIIIAVDVGVPLDKEGEGNINSLFQVSDQTINIFIRDNVKRWYDHADVLMRVPLEGFSSADFNRAADIIRAGEIAAETKRDELSRYSVDEAEYEEFLVRHRSGPSRYPTINGVEVVNNSSVNDYVISRRIDVVAGNEFDPVQLEADLTELYGLGIFELVDFRLEEKNGLNSLQILAEEKSHGRNILIFGLDYVEDLEGRISFGLLARLTMLELNRLGGEWRTDVRLGLTRGTSTEWYQPLEPSRTVFLSPVARFWYDTQDIYEDDHHLGEYRVQTAYIGMDAGLQIGTLGELRFGVRRGEIGTRVISGQVALPEQTTGRGGYTGSLIYDLLDHPDFPRNGGSCRIELFLARTALGDGFDYDRLSVDLAHFGSWGNNTVFATLAGGNSLGTDIPFFDQFVVGGPLSFSGLKPDQARGKEFGIARMGYHRTLVNTNILLGNIYVGGWLEAGNVWASQSDVSMDDVLFAGSLAIGATTIAGPVQFGYGRNENGAGSFFFTIGRQFGNFNQSKNGKH